MRAYSGYRSFAASRFGTRSEHRVGRSVGAGERGAQLGPEEPAEALPGDTRQDCIAAAAGAACFSGRRTALRSDLFRQLLE